MLFSHFEDKTAEKSRALGLSDIAYAGRNFPRNDPLDANVST